MTIWETQNVRESSSHKISLDWELADLSSQVLRKDIEREGVDVDLGVVIKFNRFMEFWKFFKKIDAIAEYLI